MGMILFELVDIKKIQDTKSSLCSDLIFGRVDTFISVVCLA